MNHLKFNPSPPSLKTIVMTKIAIHYTYNELTRDAENVRRKRYFMAADWTNEPKIEKDFRTCIPDGVLREKMKDYLRHIICLMDNWLFKHSYCVFRGQSSGHLVLKLMQDFVWTSDGCLNYVKTAEKLISGTKLNPVEKYALMCVYCMEDDIRRMYDTYDWVEDCLEMEEFRSNIYAYYWDCVLNEDEAENPDEDDDRSFEKMILDERPNNLSALEYFFDELEDDERYEFAIGVLPTMPGSYVKAILPKFTVPELQRILDTCLGDYMDNMATESDSALHALELWNFAKTFTRGKSYVKMMLKIFQCSVEIFDGEYPKWWGEFGLDLWRNTPARLKQFVLRHQPQPNFEFIMKWNRWYNKVTDGKLRDDRTLLLILSDANVEYRRSFWMKEWTGLIMDSQPIFLIRLMNLCLSGPQEVEEFKRKIISSDTLRKHLSNVSNRGYFFDLSGV